MNAGGRVVYAYADDQRKASVVQVKKWSLLAERCGRARAGHVAPV
jgi:hypothetical protein